MGYTNKIWLIDWLIFDAFDLFYAVVFISFRKTTFVLLDGFQFGKFQGIKCSVTFLSTSVHLLLPFPLYEQLEKLILLEGELTQLRKSEVMGLFCPLLLCFKVYFQVIKQWRVTQWWITNSTETFGPPFSEVGISAIYTIAFQFLILL